MKPLYLFFSCNKRKTWSSMRLITATASIARLTSLIRKYVESGKMGYAGKTGPEAVAAFRRDVTTAVAFPEKFMLEIGPLLDGGYVVRIKDGEDIGGEKR